MNSIGKIHSQEDFNQAQRQCGSIDEQMMRDNLTSVLLRLPNSSLECRCKGGHVRAQDGLSVSSVLHMICNLVLVSVNALSNGIDFKP